MKKITFLTLIILATASIYSQSYNISFTGTGAASTVDSIRVENLSKGTSVTILGTDTLHLIVSAGINEISTNDELLKVYPNPMQGQTEISFYAKQPGNAQLTIYDISGKKILINNNYYSQGIQKHILTDLKQGVYFININGENYSYNTKIISLNTTQSEAKIEFIGTEKQEVALKKCKSSKALTDMAYTVGNRLLFKGYKGIYSTINTDVPTASKTITFTFAACTDYDNNNYTIVQIGTQTWMAENLKSVHYRNGVEIPLVISNTTWSTLTTGACCNYNNDTNIGKVYGKIYNWYTLNDTSNICPNGWHASSDAEWTTLVSYLGSNAGGKIKETGTTHWNSPNVSATNESGFTALPAGARNFDGAFGDFQTNSNYWTTASIDAGNAWARSANYYYYSTIVRSSVGKKLGISARCIKD